MKTKKTRRKNSTLSCAFCHQQTARRTKRHHTFEKGSSLLIVRNVDTVVCDNCGVDYLEGPALRGVDAILQNPEHYIAMQSVAVADFKKAA